MANNSVLSSTVTTNVNCTLNESTLCSDESGGVLSSFSTSALSTTVDTSDDSKVIGHMIEKKQLLHDMDRLRIELSHKTLQLDSYKAELMNKIDDLEEKLSDATYSKQILKARLESQLKLNEDEANAQKKKLNDELDEIKKRQKQLEKENATLLGKTECLRSNLFRDNLTEEEYLELKSRDENLLSLQEYTALRLYEALQTLKVQCESLQKRVDYLSQELSVRDEEIAVSQLEMEKERKARTEQEFMTQKLMIKVEKLQSHLSNKDFKSEHFDEILCDRHDIEKEVMQLRKENVNLEALLNNKTDENVEIQKEMQERKQTLALLKQDKEYLNMQMTEATTKSKVLEGQVTVLTQEVEKIKKDREDLYEKYISVREKYKSEYEMKLRDELQLLTNKTNSELEKIKNNAKEMYERENRSLRETRDNALAEKDRAVNTEKNTMAKYEQVSQEYRDLLTSSDSRMTEILSNLKFKQFELDRLQVLHEETTQNLKQANIDIALYQEKLQVLNKEFYALQSSTDKKINELQISNTDALKKLSIYEKLEQELDDVILQAAQLESEVDRERVMFSYGYGANVPSTSKRRMQQSIHLARRVLKLERANTGLQGELEAEKKKKNELLQELSNTTNILNEAQQPYNYLIESIRVRDLQIESLKDNNTLLEEDIRKLQKERNDLAESKNKVTADLERLLNQREELGAIKNVVMKLKSGGMKRCDISERKTTTENGTSSYDFANNMPSSTMFTKHENPVWFDKLKQKHSKRGG